MNQRVTAAAVPPGLNEPLIKTLVSMTARLAVIGQQSGQFLLREPVLLSHLAHLAHPVEEPFGIEDTHCLIVFRRDHDAHDMPAARDANRLPSGMIE
jgi:hypothetical protein